MGNNTAEQKTGPNDRIQSDGCTALMYACQQGDISQVEKLLKINPASAREKDRTLKTALHYCAETRTAQCADLVYRAAPDLINIPDEDGLTPLHLAVIAGNIPLTNFLLANNADVTVIDNERHSVVHWATVCGETAALKSVLLANAPVSTPDVHGGFPLHYAAQMCGTKDQVTPGKTDNRVQSAIKDTSKLGLEVLDALLKFPGIKVNVEDGDGRQPLLWAASAGSASAVLALVAAGSVPEAADKDGLTALHCAASRGHTDCLEALLLMCGVAPDVIDTNGCTALHYAVTLGHADATALLLAHGAKVNRQDRKGRTTAHCGCAKGQVETVRMLGDHGADLWIRSARGDLPLHEASSAGRRQLVRWLLSQRPSQVNATNNDGRTPLHVAALNDNTDICKILIDHGANVNAVMTTSKNVLMTPLDCALKNGYRSTAKFLQLSGGLPYQKLQGVAVGTGYSVLVESDIVIRNSEQIVVGGEHPSYKSIPKKKVLRHKRKVKVSEEMLKSRSKHLQTNLELTSTSSSSEATVLPQVVATKTKESQTDEKFILIPVENSDQFLIKPVSTISAETAQLPGETKSLTDSNLSDNSLAQLQTTQVLIHTKEDTKEAKIVAEEEFKENGKEGAVNDVPLESTGEILSTVVTQEISEEVGTEKEVVMSEFKEGDTTQQEKKEETQTDVKPGLQDDPQDSPRNEDQVVQPEIEKQVVEVKKTTQENEIPKSASLEAEDETIKEAANVDLQGTQPDIETDTQLDAQPELPQVDTQLDTQPDIENVEQNDTQSDTQSAQQQNAQLTTDTQLDTQPNIENVVPSENQSDTQLEQHLAAQLTTDIQPDNQPGNEQHPQTDQVMDTQLNTQNDVNSPVLTTQPDTQLPVDLQPDVQPKPSLEETLREESPEKSIVEELKVTGGSEVLNEDVPVVSDPSSIEEFPENKFKSFQILPDSALRRKRLKRAKSEMIHDDEESTLHSAKSGAKLSARKASSLQIHTQKPESRELPKRPIQTCKSEAQLAELLTEESSESVTSEDHSIVRRPRKKGDEFLDLIYSDESEGHRKSYRRKGKQKSRSKSADQDSYQSDSQMLDSGFEPSPRSSRIPRRSCSTKPEVNMTTVTQTVQANIRRYHMERKLFHHLLELKRQQIRADQSNEAVLVKRAIDDYHRSILSTVGEGRYNKKDFTFKSFEKFLYDNLRKLQKSQIPYLEKLPEPAPPPLLCTHSTLQCDHAAHAYTGIPCAAYITKLNHHTIPKVGFGVRPGGFLPRIRSRTPKNTASAKGTVTLELTHGTDKQFVTLPAEKLDYNKKYYVTFTVKGQVDGETNVKDTAVHRHAKSS